MNLILHGIDPGIVDTGLVTLEFNFKERVLTARSRVWRNVTERRKRALHVNQGFLTELLNATNTQTPEKNRSEHVFIEGFRNRGRDTYQDQSMSDLIQVIYRQLGDAVIVDNTGVKKVVKKGLLSLMRMNRWPKTNHADLLSATRIALKGAIEDDYLNQLIYLFIQEQHKEKSWEIIITPTVQ